MSKWVTVFAQSQCGNVAYEMNAGGRTYKSAIKSAVSGDRIRLRFGAIYDSHDIAVSAVTVAVNGKRADVLVGGNKAFVVRSNEVVMSDEVDLAVKAGEEIEIRSYFADGTVVMTGCKVLSKYSPVGNYTDGEFVESDENVWVHEKRPLDIGIPMPVVWGVDVLAGDDTYAVAIFGASNEYLGKWVNPFADELVRRFGEVSVCNMSISGGRLLNDTGNKKILGDLFGDSGLKRFPRDVASLSGVKYVLIEIACNDVFQPGSYACEPSEVCPPSNEIIQGFETLVKMVREAGMTPVVMTLTPLKYGLEWTEEKMQVRREINDYIRNSDDFLHFDFAKYIIDENDPDAMRDDLHIGDHVHLNEKAGRIIAESFDYSLIK